MAIVVPNHPFVEELVGDTDILSSIFGFLHWKDILRARVCYKWREAAKLTEVPESVTDDGWHTQEFYVQNQKVGAALSWIADALPGMPSVNFDFSLSKTEYIEFEDGENPCFSFYSGFAEAPKKVDITPIANFRRLRNLKLNGADLNGSYPCLFDFFNLRSLKLSDMPRTRWDLGMLSGFPQLEKLRCVRVSTTGTLNCIRVIRESLVDLCSAGCSKVEGNLMDIADFPLLKKLSLNDCDKIVGDIRDIGPADFQSIESEFTDLPDSVYGADDLQSIAEAPTIMQVWYTLKKRNPHMFSGRRKSLSRDSPDYYNNNIHLSRKMPSYVEFVNAGSRLGWRWTNAARGGSCKPRWLDPEPDPSDENYDVYLKELNKIEDDVEFYKGCFQPPTLEEHLQRNAETPLPDWLRRYNQLSFW